MNTNVKKQISELPEQHCFPIDEIHLLCNWVAMTSRPGWALISNTGKYLKFKVDKKEEKKELPTFEEIESSNRIIKN